MEWYEIAELLVELTIIILVMAFFFYLLIWVMNLSIACWNDIYSCPAGHLIENMASFLGGKNGRPFREAIGARPPSKGNNT